MRSATRCLLAVSIAVAALMMAPSPADAQSPAWNRTKIWNRATTLCPPPANSGPTLFATNGQPRQVRIPNYGSEPAESVVTALRSLGLVPSSSTETSSLPAGTFIRTMPAGGTCVDPESAVTVVASNGVPPRMPGTGWLPPRPPGGVWNPPPRLVMVPYFKSQPVQTVAATLRRIRLSPGREVSESSDLPAGTFTRTDPPAGTRVPIGTQVDIYESSGPPAPREVMIPYFRAIPETSVVGALEKLGLGVGNQIQESSTLSAGTFTRTDPPGGTLVPLGRVVTVYYSSGPPPPVQHWVIIPAFGAIPERQVVAALQSLGLRVRRTVPEASDLQAGTFTRTNPPAGTRVLEGSAVVVRYSRGLPPPPIIAPPVSVNPPPPVNPPPVINPVQTQPPANTAPPVSNPVQTPPSGQTAGKTPEGNGHTYGGENPVGPVATAPPRVVARAITVIHPPARAAAPPPDTGSWLRPVLYFLAGGIVAALGLMTLWPKPAAKPAPAAAAPTVEVSLARGAAKVANANRRGLILRCLLGPRDGPQFDIRRKP